MADVPSGTDAVAVSDERHRLAVEELPTVAFILVDAQGRITSWNRGAERLLGHVQGDVVGAPLAAILVANARGAGVDIRDLEAADRHGTSSTGRWLTCKGGSPVFAQTAMVALRSNGRMMGYAVIAHPVSLPPHDAASERPRGETPAASSEDTRRQLSESQVLLAAEVADRTQAEASRIRLLRRLVVAQEEERRRLARDLHDDLGQRLTSLRLMLEGLRGPAGDPRPEAVTVHSALDLLTRTDEALDFIAWELRPAALDEMGLVKVLDTYVHEWARHAGIPAVFHSRPGILTRFAPEVEATIYRVAQEALNNVAKHAAARSVNVVLELRGVEIALLVEDDGVGLRSHAENETMIGLTGMRERALAVGGSLEIEPTPNGGTTILVRIPTSGVRPESARERIDNASGETIPGIDGVATASGSSALTGIRQRLQELQRAVGARDEFIATVAHELRNPIAPLTFQVRHALNKTEQMAAAGTAVSVEWIQSQLRGVEHRLHRLLETLDRLLDVSRLSTGRIDLQVEPLDLGEVVRDVVDTFEGELAAARCSLTLSEQGESTGVWDRLRVEQICRNLISNAIRFGAGRPIEVAVSGDTDFATLQIRDHGIGIARELQARIFERFERGVEQRSGGFGIGLWIVRNVCVAMGGTVSVESQLGEGASFTVMLPRRTAALGALPRIGVN